MHIPDGFLSPAVAGATWVAAAGGLAVALRAERRDPVPAPAGILGALAAFLFAAQMVNVPVAPGTSGHLVGSTLVALIVGPWRAVIVLAVVLAIQAVLFQDGGLTALGANLLDMGFAGAFVGFTVATLAARGWRGPRGYAVGGMLGAFAATLAAAALGGGWLALSGLYPLRGILGVMLVTHSAIGVLEAALTGAVLVTLLRWRPDLVAGADGVRGTRRPAALALGVGGLALVAAAFLAPLASDLPDGLERAALDLGFAARAQPILPALFGPRSPWPVAFAPALAAVLGTLVVALVAWGISRGLSRSGNEPHR
jgi:cobalt/nickel transport system permease protein